MGTATKVGAAKKKEVMKPKGSPAVILNKLSSAIFGSSVALPLEDRLQQIEELGDRIKGYVQFMCSMGEQAGISSEAKERAARLFYERLMDVEKQLRRIHDEFRLE